MKKFSRRITLLLLSVILLFTAGCGGGGGGGGAGDETGGSGDGATFTIGVIQYATHASLDNCYTGFLEGLAEYGLEDKVMIDFQNAQGDMANSDLQAKNMVTSKYDMIMGIATPAAMSAYSAVKDTDIPAVFSAVSDPVACGIVNSLETPGTNCTGTSDILNFENQLAMIRAFLPDAKSIGILYTTSEDNSISHLAEFEALAPDYGFEVISVGVTNASEVAAGAATLISKGVDCINNFTDNNVVDNLGTVLNAANSAGIPVFGSEVEQVVNGCLASESIDYIELGRQTGIMAAKILLGEANASTMPVSKITATTPVYNPEVAEALNIEIPAEYSSADTVSAAG